MASSTWLPEQPQLAQLVSYLNESLSGRDRDSQRKAELMLKQAKASPDFDNYLCYLLAGLQQNAATAFDTTQLHMARSAAGVMLKNDIKSSYKSLPASSQEFIKTNIFSGLADSNAQIRNYTGLVVAELIKQATIAAWPEAVQRLVGLATNEAGNTSNYAQDGASSALKSVCEDNRKGLTKASSASTTHYIVQGLIRMLQSPLPKVRANAVASLTAFIEDKSQNVFQNISDILSQLFNLAQDRSSEVRRYMCRAIVELTRVSSSVIVPYMDGLVEFMISQQSSPEDPELALEAAEFWVLTADQPHTVSLLGKHVSKIVPVLLENMVYSEDDVLRLENEAENDADQEDRQQDIRPQFASSKAARFGSGSQYENGHKDTEDRDDLSDGEIPEDDDEADSGDNPEEQWTLRKCSAASLDELAAVYPEQVFQSTLPYLQENLTHAEWPNREAAVLAIGAIADGCMDVLKQHLPQLVPFLVDLLNDKQAIVRQITCWSLGRYSAWASHLDAQGKERFFVPMMDGILKRMLDNNKRVQEAAASAFANLEENANTELANPAYCEVIVKHFAQCFAKYKEKNIFILYDCVQTLTEHVATALQSPEIVHMLMPPLITRWEQVKDTDQEMFPLLECLSYVAQCLGHTFAPYAEPMFSRCIRITYDNLQQLMDSAGDPTADTPDPDFVITSLDLLSAIIQALEGRARSLVRDSKPNMFELLHFCLENPENDVRQSAYALLGDCAIHVFSDLEPQLAQIMPSLIKQLESPKDSEDDGTFAVTNNACWSCGEISMRANQLMDPYAELLMQRFYNIISDSELPKSLHDNAVLALGRLGNACPTRMAPHLAAIGPPFIREMKTINWEDEKLHAMRGFVQVVLQNPSASEEFALGLLSEIGNGSEIMGNGDVRFRGPQGPYDGFQKLISTYNSMIPNFKSILSQLPPGQVRAIERLYSI